MEEADNIDRLPTHLLAHIFDTITNFAHLAQASSVCRKWSHAVKQSLAGRETLNFANWKTNDDSTARLVGYAYCLKELDIIKTCYGCHITDHGLYRISMARCIGNLISLSLFGLTAITDIGMVQLISRATSLQHINIGGTFLTDKSLFAIADSCPLLKTIGLWGCNHVTESGLLALVNKCRKLESINVWGTDLPVGCFVGLLAIRPALQIQPREMALNIERAALLPVV